MKTLAVSTLFSVILFMALTQTGVPGVRKVYAQVPTETPTPTPTATPTTTPTPTPTPTPAPPPLYIGEFEVEVRGDRTYFSWPDVDGGSTATEWVLEWRYSYSSERNELSVPDVSTAMLSAGTWTADSGKTFTWETVYWTVRHGTAARSDEVRALYVPPTPEPTPDPNATATPTPSPTPVPGAVGQEGNTAKFVTTVPRIEDSRNFWMVVSVIATVVAALGLRQISFPFPGEGALLVGIVTIVIGIVKTGFSPLILLLGIGFGCALVILLTRINK